MGFTVDRLMTVVALQVLLITSSLSSPLQESGLTLAPEWSGSGANKDLLSGSGSGEESGSASGGNTGVDEITITDLPTVTTDCDVIDTELFVEIDILPVEPEDIDIECSP